MSDTITKDLSRMPRLLAVLAAAGLLMIASVSTLAAEHSAVDALISLGRNLSIVDATDMMMRHNALLTGTGSSVELGRKPSAAPGSNISA